MAIVSSMAAGIAIDRLIACPGGGQGWLLLATAMRLTILFLALWSWWAMDLVFVSAIMLARRLGQPFMLARSVKASAAGEN